MAGIAIFQGLVAIQVMAAGGLLAGLGQVLARDQAHQLVLLIGHAQVAQAQRGKDLVRPRCCSLLPAQPEYLTEGNQRQIKGSVAQCWAKVK